ncbi:MAG: DUF2156 domain-containing protein [Clostridiales bacterium]|nr:DUF2156 domain-containing protein [Clostridiales bacterium]
MINFKKTELADKGWMDRCTFHSDFRACEYNFTNNFVWNDVYDIKGAEVNSQMVLNVTGPIGSCYIYPAGEGDVEQTILELKKDADDRGQQFKMICLSKDNVDVVERVLPCCFTYVEDRHGFDYVYDINKLADLNGKALHPKRTHINRFIDNNPDWSFELITPDNLCECIDMHQKWLTGNGEEGFKSITNEDKALMKALDNYEALKLEGGLIRTGGRVVAFTLGDRINSDTYDVHFEEAYKDVRGAYTMINREFARYVRDKYPDIKYMNREDDLGIEDLRRAKESYCPEFMVEKLTAICNEKPK